MNENYHRKFDVYIFSTNYKGKKVTEQERQWKSLCGFNHKFNNVYFIIVTSAVIISIAIAWASKGGGEDNTCASQILTDYLPVSFEIHMVCASALYLSRHSTGKIYVDFLEEKNKDKEWQN